MPASRILSKARPVNRLFRHHPRLTAAFFLSSALALFFAVRFLFGVIYWSQHHEEEIRPWMTIGYIGRSWGLEPREILLHAGLPQPRDHPLTLNEIAQIQGVPVDDVVKKLEAAIAEMKAGQQ